MMATIVTLCDACRQEYAACFTVKAIPGSTTTEKKKKCENYKKPFPADVLRQYLVSGKGGRS